MKFYDLNSEKVGFDEKAFLNELINENEFMKKSQIN